jgi:hypothetical protein
MINSSYFGRKIVFIDIVKPLGQRKIEGQAQKRGGVKLVNGILIIGPPTAK